MVKTIVWNRRASDSFNSIIEYLQKEWGDRVTKNFVVRTYQIIEFLSENPEMGALENYEKQIRGFVITKHNTLFYRIDGKRIILLNFFDNRQHPRKKTF
ncbi:MAG TPA: type II toxin-antitoxin system RelE/ParE family toxin [Mucilaginibacter sp.]|jgi:plasmid stabilization system protein ParE|nr:type II toxin-antitoxin system RelE/ParE family toxin [Mucilaginibacter sp.]